MLHERRRMNLRFLESGRPQKGEFAAYAQLDIDQVAGNCAVTALHSQRDGTAELFQQFRERAGDLSYAEGKWTVKQVLGHLADDERIFAYRALCIGRGDSRPLPGFDENAYATTARFEDRSLDELLADYFAVRDASLTLFQGLDRGAWLRAAVVNGYTASTRGLAFHIAGHELHHHRVVEERYLPMLEVHLP
jgi:uncharacterized damage-inducible protein DinB